MVFPFFPREFGGGKKPTIYLLLTDRPHATWKKLGFPISESEKSIGPVALLLETDNMFIVKQMDPLDEASWFPTAKSGEAIGIDRKAVSLLVYGARLK